MSKFNFNVGDEVTIREDLNTSMKLRCGVNHEMEKLRGKKAKIVKKYNSYYELDIDNNRWNWSLGMFLEFKVEISAILEKHKKWLCNEKDGERANLSGANLSGADLSGADLRRANLSGADLSGADLRRANLSGADLSGADLRRANLSGADLSGADLRRANLSGADLSGANLSGADLSGADLRCVDYNEKTSFFALQCPEEGSFIGFKKAMSVEYKSVIVKLLITENAKRSSATTRKCRCSSARVLSIESIDSKTEFMKAISSHDSSFIYEIGKTVEVEDFDGNRWNECSTGIHFFITRKEAEMY